MSEIEIDNRKKVFFCSPNHLKRQHNHQSFYNVILLILCEEKVCSIFFYQKIAFKRERNAKIGKSNKTYEITENLLSPEINKFVLKLKKKVKLDSIKMNRIRLRFMFPKVTFMINDCF